MRPFRSRVVAALVLAILMLGSLGSLANAREIPTTSFPEDPWAVPTSSFPEDSWPSFSLPMSGFPEDPWPDS
jgi:hypothetical protein